MSWFINDVYEPLWCSDSRHIITVISKNKTISLMHNADLTEKTET